MQGRGLLAALGAALWLVPACTTLLGIEGDFGDQSPDAAAGDASMGGQAGGAGHAGTAGQAGAGGPSGGSAGALTGGSAGEASGGSAGTPTGGSAGEASGGSAGTPAGGSGGAAGQPAEGGAAGAAGQGGTAGQGGSAGAEASALQAVQQGELVLAAAAATADVAVDAVVPDRTFLLFSTRFDALEPSAMQVSGQLTGPSTLTFARAGGSTAAPITIQWYLAAFNSGVHVQRGNAAMTSAMVTLPLAQPVDLARSFPLISYRNAGQALGTRDLVRARLASSSSLELSAGEAAPDGVVEWQVVQFNDAAVQRGELAFSQFESAPTVTIASIDVNRSWLLHTYDLSASAPNDIGQKLLRGRFTSPTTIQFLRQSNGVPGKISWHVITFQNGTLTHPASANFAGPSLEQNPFIGPTNPARTAVVGSALYQRAGSTLNSSTPNAGMCSCTFKLGATAVNVRRQTSAGNSGCDTNFWAIEFQ